MSKETGRKLFQLCALILVAWGIYHSLRKSSDELATRRRELFAQAAELREQAKSAIDPAERQRLAQQADRLSRNADNYWKASPVGLLGASLLYGVGMLPACLYWRRCLLAFEQPGHDLLDVMWAYFYGNLGKYFPGKAMVIVLRLAALEKHGIKKTATSITIFMETLSMMSVGGAIAALCLIALNLDWKLTVLAIGLLMCTFVPTSPPLLRYLLPKLQRGVEAATLRIWTDRITWRLLARGWMMLAVTWIAFGISLLLVLQSLPSTDFGNSSRTVIMLSSLGACALAVVLGFVSLIPGGAGVREVVLLTVLTPVVGSAVAALCGALWLRIVWLATELGAVGLLGMARLWRRYSTLPSQRGSSENPGQAKNHH